jgi:uncharacterized protein YjbI with pentapeptide repeats
MKRGWKYYFPDIVVLLIVAGLFLILANAANVTNTGFETKTVWDWLELLIIPVVLALGAFYLNRSERAVERQAAEDRAKLEREIATDRQQEAALQAYLDRLAELLLNKDLRRTENEEVRNVARIRTLTVLRGLDPNRKVIVLRFLYESGLIAPDAIIDLRGADFTGIDLEKAILPGIVLEGAILYVSNLAKADLQGANLRHVDLIRAHLQHANLDKADLSIAALQGAKMQGASLIGVKLDFASLQGASLQNVHLTNASLQGAYLGGSHLDKAFLKSTNMQAANLGGTDLEQTYLENVDLRDADLSGANLRNAYLAGAQVSESQLSAASSLQGATMPNGTKHD